MDYIVLVKEIPDIDTVKFDDSGLVDNNASQMIANPSDLNALEAALLLRQEDERVLAVSLGCRRKVLEEAASLGADHAYLIDTEEVESWDSRTTALAIAKLVEKLRLDGEVGEDYLVLAGSQGADFDSGQTPVRLAEHLGIAHVAYCEEVSLDDDTITAKCNVVGGYTTLSSPVPACLTITETANEPRYASFKLIRKAARDQSLYTTIPFGDLGITREERTGLMTSDKPPEKPAVKVFDEEEAEECVNSLLQAMRDDGNAMKGGSQ